MPTIVTRDEVKTYLGDAPATADDALIDALIDNVEALFTSATLRQPGYYTRGDDRTEVRDGTGSCRLYLDYPIAEDGLISVTLGNNASSPTETLDPYDPTVIQYTEGSRCLTRVDGGWFGRAGQPRYVTIEYEHDGNRPADAKLAIMEVVASVYRQRGSKGMKSETVGDFYSYTRDDAQAAATSSVAWQLAVAANTPLVLA